MDSLRQTLENQGLRDVVYMVVNHQGAQAQAMHGMLTARLSEHISLHKQDEAQADVWHTLGGSKDDFFIYDRCGRLAHRISLPLSIIGHGNVARAIKDTYCNAVCGECAHETTETRQECAPETDTQVQPAPQQDDTRHQCHHGHHQGHRHHGDAHHGDNQCTHTQGSGRDHAHAHAHGLNHDHGHHGDRGHHQGADRLEAGLVQQPLRFHRLPQHDPAAAAPARP